MRFGSISVSAPPASSRANAAGARDRCFLRNDPVLGQEVWSGLCSSSAQEAAELAAKRLLIRRLKEQGVAPKRMITGKLRSYAAAKRQIMPTFEHRSHKGLNNRAENLHLPL